MLRFRSRRSLRLRRRASKARVKRPARLSKPIARAVKAIINRQQERKYRSQTYIKLQNCVTNNISNEMFSCIPQTEMAGTSIMASSSTRIGQKLTCARAYTDFHVSFAPGITGSKDLVVKLWVLTSKELKNMDDILSWGVPPSGGTVPQRPLPINFLNDGNGGTTIPLGNLYDLDYPVETEQWTPEKIFTFRLQKSSQVLQNNTQPYNTANPAAYQASSGSTFRRFRVYHKAPKVWQYDGNITSNYPNNFAPVWCLTYAHADGSAPVPGNVDVQVNVTNHLEFYDA